MDAVALYSATVPIKKLLKAASYLELKHFQITQFQITRFHWQVHLSLRCQPEVRKSPIRSGIPSVFAIMMTEMHRLRFYSALHCDFG